ncbi:unnamed protein product [Rhizopus stolonifer]
MPPSKVKKGNKNKNVVKKPAAANTKGNKNTSTANKKDGKKKAKEFVAVPEREEYDFSDEDIEFFSENKGFTSFLSGLDAKELTRNEAKKKKKVIMKKKPQKSNTLDSSDDESLNNFEEADSD